MFRPGNPLPGTAIDDQASPRSEQGKGQPRPMEDLRQPSAAERVRTLVESRVSAALSIPGIELSELGSGVPETRAVNTDGDVILLVPADSPAGRAALHAQDDDVAAVMEVIDVAPVSVPHRIRGRGWVSGWLTAVRGEQREPSAQLLFERNPSGPSPRREGWLMLRLEVGETYVDDLWGASYVEAEDFAAAEPDPLCQHEAELLQHLAATHPDHVDRLRSLLDEASAGRDTNRRAVPLALDRYGLRVRFCGGHENFDVRFDFPEPVGDVRSLRREMHRLFQAAG